MNNTEKDPNDPNGIADPNAGVRDPHSASASTTKTALADAKDAPEHPTRKENELRKQTDEYVQERQDAMIGETDANGVIKGARERDENADRIARENHTMNSDNHVDNPYLNEAKLAEDETHPVPTKEEREDGPGTKLPEASLKEGSRPLNTDKPRTDKL